MVFNVQTVSADFTGTTLSALTYLGTYVRMSTALDTQLGVSRPAVHNRLTGVYTVTDTPTHVYSTLEC